MTQASDYGRGRLEAITVEATQAAARGEWDHVIACYQKRDTLLTAAPLSAEDVARIQALDREVAERARVAQSGLAVLLEEAGHIRRRMRDLRQWQGGGAGDAGRITKHL